MGTIGLGGCQSPPPSVVPPSTVTDPCAERLHELCGALLLHRSIHGKLPERLTDLRGAAGGGDLSFECPSSGKPYLYDRDGIVVPGRPGRIILRDPLPSPSGIRWAIAILESDRSQPLNTRVIALVEPPPIQGGTPEKRPRPDSPEE